ncbi:MAG: hypothetical protein P8O79_06925 [Halieaceae bacterium]|nr:hypothetical protein [Halieaceae bacterium]
MAHIAVIGADSGSMMRKIHTGRNEPICAKHLLKAMGIIRLKRGK